MKYRKYERKDISAIRDILENDLGYNCELDMLKCQFLRLTVNLIVLPLGARQEILNFRIVQNLSVFTV